MIHVETGVDTRNEPGLKMDIPYTVADIPLAVDSR